MAKGFSLVELAVTVCIAAVLVTFWLPRASRLLDWIATDHAVRDVTTALAVGRSGRHTSAATLVLYVNCAFRFHTIRCTGPLNGCIYQRFTLPTRDIVIVST